MPNKRGNEKERGSQLSSSQTKKQTAKYLCVRTKTKKSWPTCGSAASPLLPGVLGMGVFSQRAKSPTKSEEAPEVDASVGDTEASQSQTTQEQRPNSVKIGGEGGRVKFGGGADNPRKEASRRHETDFKSADAAFFRVENAVEENH